jgi:hypothetical protein
MWEDGKIIDLPELDDRNPGVPYAINNHGVAVGAAYNPDALQNHAVMWIDGKVVDLHPPQLPGRFASIAWDINDNGQIVGHVHTGSPLYPEPYLANPGEHWKAVNDLVPPHRRTGRFIDAARQITNAGQIRADAKRPGFQHYLTTWPVVLTPIHSTMMLGDPVPGSAGSENSVTVSKVTPGQRVFVYGSRYGGGAKIPGCDLLQNALQLDGPILIGSSVADENGVATISKNVPIAARNQWVLIQAVVPGECAISQLVVHRFE